jgi:hypothetical protein
LRVVCEKMVRPEECESPASGGQVIPAPANDLEIGKVGLPQLVDGGRLILELASGFHDDEGRAGNQVMRFQQMLYAGFRDEEALGVGKRHRKLSEQ